MVKGSKQNALTVLDMVNSEITKIFLNTDADNIPYLSFHDIPGDSAEDTTVASLEFASFPLITKFLIYELNRLNNGKGQPNKYIKDIQTEFGDSQKTTTYINNLQKLASFINDKVNYTLSLSMFLLIEPQLKNTIGSQI